MTADSFYGTPREAIARHAAAEFRLTQRVMLKLDQQHKQWERYGMPVPDWFVEWLDATRKNMKAKERECMSRILLAWGTHPVALHARGTRGLGPAVLLVLSIAPPLIDFPNPAKFWRYVGLHAARASDRRYNAELKAWCLFRVADPCVKLMDSPYRAVYDARRSTRPEMLPAGECATCDAAYAKRKATGKAGWDCHNMGGPHYKPAHARVDALGVTAKAVMLDAWRIAHGFEPIHGG